MHPYTSGIYTCPERSLLELAGSRGTDIQRLAAGARIQLDERTSVEVLWPPPGREGLSANDTSLVLRITCDGSTVLLPGDIDDGPQGELTGGGGPAGLLIRAEVLVLPHHGSWRASLEQFVGAVSPGLIVVSNTREAHAPAGHEEAGEFFARLQRGYRYYSTPRNGWVQVRFGGGSVEVRAMR